MVDFKEIIQNLIDIGFYDIFLPFILTYVVIFAILQKSKIFEGGGSNAGLAKNVNAVIAFVFGLFVVAAYNIVTIIQVLIVKTVLIVMFILCVLIVLAFIFGDKYTELFEDKRIKYALAIIFVLTILVILLYILGFWEWIEDWLGDNLWGSETWITILAVLGIGGILFWVSNGSDGKSGGSE